MNKVVYWVSVFILALFMAAAGLYVLALMMEK